MPIKSLLGHRSQAPPEVRHVSGQHVKEFTDFLLNYPDDLVVNEETESVHLKEFTGAITKMYSEDGTTRATTSASATPSSTSPSAIRSAQDNSLLAERIKTQLSSGPAPLSELLSRLRQDYESLGRDFPYSTPENLRTFLKIYPGVFQIQGGLVSLATCSSLPPSLLRSPPPSPSKQLNASNSRISLKDRVSSVIQRAVAENNDGRLPLPRNGSSESFVPSAAAVASSSPSGELWFSHDRVRLVSQAEALEAAVREVSARWKAVAVDIKGVNLGPEGRVSSVHISNAGHGAEESGGVQTYIFDFLQLPTAMIKGI